MGIFNKKSKAHEIIVYVVELTYEDSTKEAIAVTGLYFELSDHDAGSTSLIEIGKGASETHPTRGIPGDRRRSSDILKDLNYLYGAGTPLYMNFLDVRAVRVVAIEKLDFGEVIWQE